MCFSSPELVQFFVKVDVLLPSICAIRIERSPLECAANIASVEIGDQTCPMPGVAFV